MDAHEVLELAREIFELERRLEQKKYEFAQLVDGTDGTASTTSLSSVSSTVPTRGNSLASRILLVMSATPSRGWSSTEVARRLPDDDIDRVRSEINRMARSGRGVQKGDARGLYRLMGSDESDRENRESESQSILT